MADALSMPFHRAENTLSDFAHRRLSESGQLRGRRRRLQKSAALPARSCC